MQQYTFLDLFFSERSARVFDGTAAYNAIIRILNLRVWKAFWKAQWGFWLGHVIGDWIKECIFLCVVSDFI